MEEEKQINEQCQQTNNNIENSQQQFTPTYKIMEASDEDKLKYANKFSTNESKIEEAAKLKNEGNEFFKQKQYKKALGCYHKVFLYVKSFLSEEDELYKYTTQNQKITSEQLTVVQNLKMQTFLNMAQIYIYEQKYVKAIEAASNSLSIQSSAKGFYRRGVAYMHNNDFEIAEKDFQEVLKIEPQNQEVRQQIKILQQKQKQYDQQQAKTYQNMFK